MNNLRKAAEMAATDLEELISWHGIRDSNDKLMPAHNQTPEIKSAIETLEQLRQALLQPEQEPVAFEEKLPDQNPPPWVRDYKPKREWQGLTRKEAEDVVDDFITIGGDVENWVGYWRAIEAKLKEKNT